MMYRVLIIEESAREISFYSNLIKEVDHCKIDFIHHMPEFLDWVERSKYHLIIISESLSGFLLLEHIHRFNPTTGVIIVSNQATIEKAVAAIRFGAEDYLQKPINAQNFKLAVKRSLDKSWLSTKTSLFHNGIQRLAYVDDATGLFNSRYLHSILDKEIDQSLSHGRKFAVLFIDADRFKSINDQYGHPIGTKLLHELGHHLKKHVRERDTIFRYGGDEFVAVLSPCDWSTANMVAERIQESVKYNAFLRNYRLNIHLTVSIGIALFPEHAKTKQDIIDYADQAMYQAKGRNGNFKRTQSSYSS